MGDLHMRSPLPQPIQSVSTKQAVERIPRITEREDRSEASHAGPEMRQSNATRRLEWIERSKQKTGNFSKEKLTQQTISFIDIDLFRSCQF